VQLSEQVDEVINRAIEQFDGVCHLESPLESSFEKLISMGELIDRISVVNLKLFTLKSRVAASLVDEKFLAWAAGEDVKLCIERSRLKICIDQKLNAMIGRHLTGDATGGSNQETKMY
jgi:hypothetical protein